MFGRFCLISLVLSVSLIFSQEIPDDERERLEELRKEAAERWNQMPVETLQLHTPLLSEIAEVLETGLKKDFANVSVNVVTCPDLTQPPFYLAAKGLSGRSSLADVGDQNYLTPVPIFNRIYNMDVIADRLNFSGAFLLGAAGGPFNVIGMSCEFIANTRTKNGSCEGSNLSYVAKINLATEDYELFSIPWSSDFGFMMQALLSEGKTGQVLEVKASQRIQETNIVTSMREALHEEYGSQPLGLGGALLINKGIIRMHVQPNFSSDPLDDPVANDNWLKYFNMTAPMVCPSVFVTHDPGLRLRLEHTHCFSRHGDGGHYHYDVTPDEVEYIGYYMPAEQLYRVDRPVDQNI